MSLRISEKYDDSLSKIVFNDYYDIRIHSVQTAILILYGEYLSDLNLNEINYGYYCPITESLIKEFQKINGMNVTGVLDKETWNKIHLLLKALKGSVIIQSGTKRIALVDVDALLNEYITNGNKNEDNTVFEYEISNGSNYNEFTQYENSNGNVNYIEYLKDYELNGIDTSFSDLGYGDSNSGKIFDEMIYNYIVNGGTNYGNANFAYNISTGGTTYNANNLSYNLNNGSIVTGNISFGYNIGNGGESWHEKYLATSYPVSNAGSNRDYDYIYNLLANSIYEGNVDTTPVNVSYSNSNVGKFKGKYGESNNDSFFTTSGYTDPYFSSGTMTLRKSKFDIEIVYGAKGNKSRKILDVMPISVSQEVDASGEPIYDIYEFIARDVVDGA